MDIAKQRDRIVAEHGGLSDRKCMWKDCEKWALADQQICFEHTNPFFFRDAFLQNPRWEKVAERDDFDCPPDKLNGAQDAMHLLASAAKRWDRSLGIRWATSDEEFPASTRPQDQQPLIDQWDVRLERFVIENTGALESLLLDSGWQERLAYTRTQDAAKSYREGSVRGGLPESVLGTLLTQPGFEVGEFLWRTLRVCNFKSLIYFAIQCHSQFKVVLNPPGNILLLTQIVRWLGTDRFASLATELVEIAPVELIDVLSALSSGPGGDVTGNIRKDVRFPTILPDMESDIIELGSEKIALQLATYRGLTVEEMNALLSQQGFLVEGENVGDVILRDAITLRELGVSRHELALKLLKTFQSVGWRDEMEQVDELDATLLSKASFNVERTQYIGHHQDPFHSVDTYDISEEVKGSSDCYIGSEKGEINFSDMHPYLIRRACFFEGEGQYRLDPGLACKVLGLV